MLQFMVAPSFGDKSLDYYYLSCLSFSKVAKKFSKGFQFKTLHQQPHVSRSMPLCPLFRKYNRTGKNCSQGGKLIKSSFNWYLWRRRRQIESLLKMKAHAKIHFDDRWKKAAFMKRLDCTSFWKLIIYLKTQTMDFKS